MPIDKTSNDDGPPYEVTEPIPCIDCIAYPACRAQVRATDDLTDQRMALIKIIYDKCSILCEYLYDPDVPGHIDATKALSPKSYIKMHTVLHYSRDKQIPIKTPTDGKLISFFRDMSMALLKRTKWK